MDWFGHERLSAGTSLDAAMGPVGEILFRMPVTCFSQPFGLAMAAKDFYQCMNTTDTQSVLANARNYSAAGKTCQGGKFSPWQDDVAFLHCILLEMRELGDAKRVDDLREKFFAGFRNLSLAAAIKILRDQGWRGNLRQAAEDIASECTLRLLRQERQGTGIFQRDYGAGYLNKTIWVGARQRACDLWRSLRRMDSLDESRFDVGVYREDAESLWKDISILRDRLEKGSDSKYRTPAGMLPLDGVLNKALARAGDRKLHEEAGVSKRTWQRLEQRAREDLGEILRDSPIWGRDRETARRKVTLHRDLE